MKHLGTKEIAVTEKCYMTDEMLDYVGVLAKLELSEEEKEHAKKDMGQMLAYIAKLNQLDTEGVEPLTHVFPLYNVFRADAVTEADGRKDALKNAPAHRDGGFLVPETI